MRALFAAFVVAGFAVAPAASADTLNEVTTRGIFVTVGEHEIEMNFTPDGRFSGLNGLVVGSWRIDGANLCTTGDSDRVENCVEYPAGKNSGDSFEVPNPQGPITVRIK